MKQDEVNMMLNVDQEMHLKRKQYILNKWQRKGWVWKSLGYYTFTDEYRRIQYLIKNKKEIIRKLDGRVVIVTFKDTPQTVGILKDNGDNGWSLYTSGCLKHSYSYFLSQDFDEIAHVELHPHPHNIWRKMNYLSWKYHKSPDRFHHKITKWSSGSVRDYGIDFKGPFTASHPLGEIGDCFPCCQCKFL